MTVSLAQPEQPGGRTTGDRARDVLRQVFGFDIFRGHQQEIIGHVIGGGDALVLMPTGGGKSLCYQIPALVRPGIGVVVSPLIALMKDQVDALRQPGCAPRLNSCLAWSEARAVERRSRRRARFALRRAGAAADAAVPRDAGTCRRPVRDRRGALRLAMGPRFPAGIPPASLCTSVFPTCRARAHRDRRRATREDIVDAARAGRRPLFVAGFDRPNIRYRVAEKRRQIAASRLPASRASARTPASSIARPAARSRRWPISGDGRLRAALSCRARARNTSGIRTASSRRRGSSSWRPSPSAWASTSRMSGSSPISTLPQEPRSLLPGDRPRRARRAERRRLDDLWSRRRHPAQEILAGADLDDRSSGSTGRS